MTFKEIQMDLLQMPQGWTLAHCISGDFALGAGIAKTIDEVFNMRERLKMAWEHPYYTSDELVGECLPVGNVFNLVTKSECRSKPTWDNFCAALADMVDYVRHRGIKKLAMPRIGCGLDRLNWEQVKAKILDVFKDDDIEIVVCYL